MFQASASRSVHVNQKRTRSLWQHRGHASLAERSDRHCASRIWLQWLCFRILSPLLLEFLGKSVPANPFPRLKMEGTPLEIG